MPIRGIFSTGDVLCVVETSGEKVAVCVASETGICFSCNSVDKKSTDTFTIPEGNISFNTTHAPEILRFKIRSCAPAKYF